MPMAASEIERTILAAIPDARIEIEDLAGDGDHYACQVTSETFRGLSRVRQHKLVYDAFGTRMGTELHAMALKTLTP
ncbi:BolA family transcriptional regulator [Gluconobacter sp. OJB]|uniref:BolA family transcriptional regulator n=1 Tax=Gluconobacter sp. OJB TaxID=3145196 RepID=UPI0031F80C46